MAHGEFLRESTQSPAEKIPEASFEEAIHFEEPCPTFEGAIANVQRLLDQNERKAKREEIKRAQLEFAERESEWKARHLRDEASAGQRMDQAMYRLAISNWQAAEVVATSVDEKAAAKRAVLYFSESLDKLTRYEAAKAEMEKLALFSEDESVGEYQNLFESYVREPEAFRAFIFTQALERWSRIPEVLQPEVRGYAEAVIELERSKDACAMAQVDWYREHCAEAYDALKQQQRLFLETENACEAWQTAVSVPWATQDDWKKLSHSTCTRSRIGLFGIDTSREPLDGEAIGEKEAEFRELHSDLFEKRNSIDAGLDEPCRLFVERTEREPELFAQVLRQDGFHSPEGVPALTSEKLKQAILRSGTRWYLPEFLSQIDEPLKAAILASREIREEIQEARQTMSRRMTQSLDLERKALLAASYSLEQFESASREEMLAEYKRDILEKEAEILKAHGMNSVQIDRFLQRLELATFETFRMAEMQMSSVDKTSTFEQHLEEVGRSKLPRTNKIGSAGEVTRVRECQSAQKQLQTSIEDILEELNDAESRGSTGIAGILARAEQTLFSESEADRAWNDPQNLLPYRGISQVLESSLSTFADRSLFRVSFEDVNTQVFTTTLSEGARVCGRLLTQLIERIEGMGDESLTRLAPLLRVRYATLLDQG